MKFPKVSVLIVGRNCREDLKKLFRSLKKINYPKNKIEVIYVDDASSDGSENVAERFGAKVFKFYERQGRAKVRNFALKKAKSNFVAWIDSDCEIVDRNWIQNMMKHLKDGIIGVAGSQLKPKHGLAKIAWYLPELAYKSEKEEIISWAPTTSSLFRKKPLIEEKFDEDFVTAEDLEICWRLWKKGYKFKRIPEAQIIHNFRPTFKKFFLQQLERGYCAGLLIKKHNKKFFRFLNIIFYFSFIFLLISVLFPVLLIFPLIFPLIFFVGINYVYFFPKTIIKFYKEEKDLKGVFKLIFLQYLRTYALTLGLIKFKLDRMRM